MCLETVFTENDIQFSYFSFSHTILLVRCAIAPSVTTFLHFLFSRQIFLLLTDKTDASEIEHLLRLYEFMRILLKNVTKGYKESTYFFLLLKLLKDKILWLFLFIRIKKLVSRWMTSTVSHLRIASLLSLHCVIFDVRRVIFYYTLALAWLFLTLHFYISICKWKF